MSVSDTDIVYYKSANGSSEGGVKSATEIVDGVANAVFPNISDGERVAGGTLYRKWFAANEHGTDAMVVPTAWIVAMPVGTAESIGVGFNSADDDEAIVSGNMTAWSGNAVLAAASDGADTRTLTIIGRNNAAVPIADSLTLTGAVEIVTATSFSIVYAVLADAKNASRTITIRQGAAGTIRGTVLTNRGSCFLWLNPVLKATGIVQPNLVAGASLGFWDRLVWAPAISAQRPADSIIAIEEA